MPKKARGRHIHDRRHRGTTTFNDINEQQEGVEFEEFPNIQRYSTDKVLK
ncbi:hypothetical protein J7J00_18115 [Bacillus sp. ISL-4]|nr:hypothetical protein [Bacillus sp. ISL-4]MBT2667395.1 hypothetical protein [Bacillus sp. ISL-4]